MEDREKLHRLAADSGLPDRNHEEKKIESAVPGKETLVQELLSHAQSAECAEPGKRSLVEDLLRRYGNEASQAPTDGGSDAREIAGTYGLPDLLSHPFSGGNPPIDASTAASEKLGAKHGPLDGLLALR